MNFTAWKEQAKESSEWEAQRVMGSCADQPLPELTHEQQINTPTRLHFPFLGRSARTQIRPDALGSASYKGKGAG